MRRLSHPAIHRTDNRNPLKSARDAPARSFAPRVLCVRAWSSNRHTNRSSTDLHSARCGSARITGGWRAKPFGGPSISAPPFCCRQHGHFTRKLIPNYAASSRLTSDFSDRATSSQKTDFLHCVTNSGKPQLSGLGGLFSETQLSGLGHPFSLSRLFRLGCLRPAQEMSPHDCDGFDDGTCGNGFFVPLMRG